jgi:thioredoxin
MKKYSFLSAFLMLFTLISCSGNTEGNNGSAGNGGQAPAGNPDVKVIYLTTDQFQKLVWDYKKDPKNFVYEGKIPCVIDFYADWCRPCKMVAPIMEDIAKQYEGKLIVYKVNTDNERELSALFQIRSIPAILYVPKSGKPQMSVGAQSKDEYIKAINEILLVK